MSGKRPPQYDLRLVQERISSGDPTQPFLNRDALVGAGAAGLDVDSVRECLLALDDTSHLSTTPCLRVNGAFVDRYRVTFRGLRVTIGLQMPNTRVVVSSFSHEVST